MALRTVSMAIFDAIFDRALPCYNVLARPPTTSDASESQSASALLVVTSLRECHVSGTEGHVSREIVKGAFGSP